MSKEARESKKVVSPQVAEKLCELATQIAQEEYGVQGRPPLETTFAEIEEIGHQAGQLLAGVIDQQFTAAHGQHFAESQTCPQCGGSHDASFQERELTTRDGPVVLLEAACHCPECRRDFFPSTGEA